MRPSYPDTPLINQIEKVLNQVFKSQLRNKNNSFSLKVTKNEPRLEIHPKAENLYFCITHQAKTQ